MQAPRRLDELNDSHVEELADLLTDGVEGGASIGFLNPFARGRAVAYWRRIATDVAEGRRLILVAGDDQGICGSVQLVLDQPENQPHRADLVKMLVHRRARRRGLGASLVLAAEESARDLGKRLLVLDAVTAGDAARLYERLGWRRVGDIPGYALYPDGRVCSTTYYYRVLETDAGA